MSHYPEQKFKKEWVNTPMNSEILEWVESFAKYLCCVKGSEDSSNFKKPLTTSQLRKFFGKIKLIETNVEQYKADLVMLKPMLAYAVGRDKKIIKGQIENQTRILEFYEELTIAIDGVLESKDLKISFDNFKNILEATVAYHKLYDLTKTNN